VTAQAAPGGNLAGGNLAGGDLAGGGLAIGIVLFRPDPVALAATLRAVAPAAEMVLLFLNAPLSAAARRVVAAHPGPAPQLLNDGTNLGLGVAYNRMAEVARGAGLGALLLLDQDSAPPAGLPAALCAMRDRLRQAGECPAAIGPLPVAAEGSGCKAPRLFPRPGLEAPEGARPLQFLISSGTLLDLEAWAAIGWFREDFFIDAIDIEWCFRAWARHFSCWMMPGQPMPHRLGQGVLRVPLLGMRLARQPPARLYTYVRNQAAMLRLPSVPLRWKCRLLPYMAVQAAVHLLASHGDRQTLRAFLLGLLDGLRNRLGPVSRGFG
jgi:rhamnosyltransferase